MRVLLGALVVLGFATGCASLEEKEREYTFRVVKGDAGWYSGVPDSACRTCICRSTRTRTRQRIHAWWWPDADPKAPVIFYLHGSRWNLTGHVRRIEQLRRFGFSVFAIDYRGFGKSDGDLPSEQMCYEDASAGWAWLATASSPTLRAASSTGIRSAAPSPSTWRRACRDGSARAARAGARPHRRVVVHVAARCRLRAELQLAADEPHPVAEVRFDREDQGRRHPRAGRARRRRSLHPTAVFQALYEAAPNPEEAAAGRERQPQQQHVDRRRRVPARAGRIVRPLRRAGRRCESQRGAAALVSAPWVAGQPAEPQRRLPNLRVDGCATRTLVSAHLLGVRAP